MLLFPFFLFHFSLFRSSSTVRIHSLFFVFFLSFFFSSFLFASAPLSTPFLNNSLVFLLLIFLLASSSKLIVFFFLSFYFSSSFSLLFSFLFSFSLLSSLCLFISRSLVCSLPFPLPPTLRRPKYSCIWIRSQQALMHMICSQSNIIIQLDEEEERERGVS